MAFGFAKKRTRSGYAYKIMTRNACFPKSSFLIRSFVLLLNGGKTSETFFIANYFSHCRLKNVMLKIEPTMK